MDIFSIIVGIATIINMISSIISLLIIHNISVRMNNSGNHNSNTMNQNKGIANKINVNTNEKDK